MQFIDLKAQYQVIEKEVKQRIEAVFAHGQFIMGPEIAELEKKLADFVGVKHAITVANGTDALLIAMMALNIQPGDEIITTAFTFFATIETILMLGAVPIVVDIDPKTYNIDPHLIESAITDKTRAIIPVSLYGQCADFQEINTIAAKYHLPVIEDAAQSFGALHHGRRSCCLTTIACTSFFPAKPLGAYGDAGAMFTNSDELASIIQSIRLHGEEGRYQHVRLGFNGRMDTLQAAMMLPKLDIYEQEIAARQRNAEQYTSLLSPYVRTPFVESFNTSVYAQYTIEVNHREALRDYLQAAGIPTAIHYPKPVHHQPVMKQYSSTSSLSFPVAEKAAQSVLSLPFHAYCTKQQIEQVAHKVLEFLDIRE